jgi:PleD family two-component response regulator
MILYLDAAQPETVLFRRFKRRAANLNSPYIQCVLKGFAMGGTILVVDDDEKLNRLLKRFLKDYGYTVHSATEADEGLKKARTVLPV